MWFEHTKYISRQHECLREVTPLLVLQLVYTYQVFPALATSPSVPNIRSSSDTRASHLPTSASFASRSRISRSSSMRSSASLTRVQVHEPAASPLSVRRWVWYFISVGLCWCGEKFSECGENECEGEGGCECGTESETHRRDMVMRVIPKDFACSYIRPSTSLETALVHSVLGKNYE